MKRFKSYALWVSLFSLIGLIVNDVGVLTPDEYEKYVTAILSVLVAGGIITNPSIGKGFRDNDN